MAVYVDPRIPTEEETIVTYQQQDYTAAYIIAIIFTIIWVALGVAAFIMSLVCFGYSGTTAQQVIGLILAILFGPFYWIYYLVVKNYCRGPVAKKGASAKRR
jgi:hypothetical protein